MITKLIQTAAADVANCQCCLMKFHLNDANCSITTRRYTTTANTAVITKDIYSVGDQGRQAGFASLTKQKQKHRFNMLAPRAKEIYFSKKVYINLISSFKEPSYISVKINSIGFKLV